MLGIELSFGDDLALAGKQLWLDGVFSLAMHLLICFHVLNVIPVHNGTSCVSVAHHLC